jgi:CdiI immunity protein
LRPRTPLGQFFGSYLHQDFAHFHSSAWAAVQEYVENVPLEERPAARSELGRLLASCHTEQELSDAADRVHLDYHPPGEGFTYREWLEKVERYLREHEA